MQPNHQTLHTDSLAQTKLQMLKQNQYQVSGPIFPVTNTGYLLTSAIPKVRHIKTLIM